MAKNKKQIDELDFKPIIRDAKILLAIYKEQTKELKEQEYLLAKRSINPTDNLNTK